MTKFRGHLPDDLVRTLYRALVQSGLVNKRRELYSGINPEISALLSNDRREVTETFGDLFEMNGIQRLDDGSTPLQQVLANAIDLSYEGPEQALFEKLLEVVTTGTLSSETVAQSGEYEEQVLISAAPKLQPPGAAYDEAWFVKRTREIASAENNLASEGAPVVLWGAERFGKTWLLHHLLERIRRQMPSARVVQIDLRTVEEERRRQLPSLLRAMGELIVEALGVSPTLIQSAWEEPLSAQAKLTRLLSGLLDRSTEPFFLAIDRADAVWGTDTGDEVFALLRSWCETARRQPWSRFRLTLAVSTTPALLARNPNKSPFNLTAPIIVGDLDEGAILELASLYRVSVDREALEQVKNLIGGHPFLVRQLFYRAALEGRPPTELLGEDQDVFDEFLGEHRRRFSRDPVLFRTLRSVIQGEPVTHSDQTEQLLGLGMIVNQRGVGLKLRCQIYRRLEL